jgi:glyoxylase-like metal-dependent hydrolase (beta-lactamase superfamily II)
MELKWQELDGDHDVFGDGSVMVIPTPGHTRGHQSLLVKLEGQTIFLLADASYLLGKLRSRSLPGVLWSPDAMVASWERIEEIEREENAHLMTTHELDYETSVRMAPDAWYEKRGRSRTTRSDPKYAIRIRTSVIGDANRPVYR